MSYTEDTPDILVTSDFPVKTGGQLTKRSGLAKKNIKCLPVFLMGSVNRKDEGLAVQAPVAQYFDRQPVVSSIRYGADDISPHGDATRASVTIQDGKLGEVTNALISWVQKTAPTGVGLNIIIIKDTDSGARLLNTYAIGTVQGSNRHLVLGNAGVYLAGNEIEIITNDNSTNGTNTYELSINLIEFDQ